MVEQEGASVFLSVGNDSLDLAACSLNYLGQILLRGLLALGSSNQEGALGL